MTDRALSSELEDFGQQIADHVESFLLALEAISRGEGEQSTVGLLLLEVSQLLLAGGRLGVSADFHLTEEFEPDPGPDPDLDIMRLRLAEMLDGVDEYSEVFDPYEHPAEVMSQLLSDELTSIAAALAHGLRHFRDGRVHEALWWWQFSYISSWGAEASSALRALQSIVAHDRLDADYGFELDQVAEADRILGTPDSA
jgi:hypothetical protein